MKYFNGSNSHISTIAQCAVFSLAALVFYSVMIDTAQAVGGALCGMIGSVMGGGSLARAIASVGVLMVGVGATLGKISWTLALTVAVGIAAMFSAASIVDTLNTTAGGMGCFGT